MKSVNNIKRVLFLSSGLQEKKNFFFLQLSKDYNAKKIGLKTDKNKSIIKKIITLILNKLRLPLFNHYNNEIISDIRKHKYDLIIVVKGIFIYTNTILEIKKRQSCNIINWTPDNMYLNHNNTYWYVKNLKYYDIVYTTKDRNIKYSELESLGAKRVEYVYQNYSEEIHKKMNCEKIYDVCFVGSFEEERFKYIKYLAMNGIKVSVFGSGWGVVSNQIDNLDIAYKNVINLEYSRTIASSKVCLCFLRKKNFDSHTSRTVEIPAIGSFMLAERSFEHDFMFKENKEADYFDSKVELLKKTKFYLKNEKLREEIALAGHRKCMSGGYGFQSLINL